MSQKLEAPSKDGLSQPPSRYPAGWSKSAPIRYQAKLAGVPDALIFFCFFSCIKARKGPLPRAGKFAGYTKAIRKSPKSAGVPDALIFFCFFSCIKARKEGYKQASGFLLRQETDRSRPFSYRSVQETPRKAPAALFGISKTRSKPLSGVLFRFSCMHEEFERLTQMIMCMH